MGIVALKNIEVGTELTFDYQFDAYKTPLMRCLCGVQKCKGYLGLAPIDQNKEDMETKLDTMPCEICATNFENDEETMILCDSCNLGFHIGCLTPKLEEIPPGDWFCPNCFEKQKKIEISQDPDQNKEKRTIITLRSKKKAQFEELSTEICSMFDKWL